MVECVSEVTPILRFGYLLSLFRSSASFRKGEISKGEITVISHAIISRELVLLLTDAVLSIDRITCSIHGVRRGRS